MRYHNIEDPETRTRRQIGLYYQSHYAHKGMIPELAVPGPDSSQLGDRVWRNQF